MRTIKTLLKKQMSLRGKLVLRSMGIVLFLAGSYGAMAQQSLLVTGKSTCPGTSTTFSTAIVNYCTGCTYTYDDGTGGTNSVGQLSSLPGGYGDFSTGTTTLPAGTYNVYSSGTSIGTFTISNYSINSINTSRTLASTPSVCHGTQVTLSASGGSNYSWRVQGSPTVIGTGSSITVSAQGGQDVYYEVTGTVNCSQTRTGTVYVGGLTTVGATTISGSNFSRCIGGGTTGFSASAPNAVNGIKWYISPSSAGSINLNTGVVSWNAGFPTTASATATITAIASGNCGSTSSDTKTVTVKNPTAFNMTGGGSSCTTGTSHAIGLNGSTSGVVYRLYRVGNPNVVIEQKNGTGSAFNFGTYNTFDTYYVIATDNTCTKEMYNRVSISQLTPGGITTSRTLSQTPFVCAGTQVTLSASGGSNYVWRLGGVVVGSGSSITVTAVEGRDDTYEVTANESVCGNQVTGTSFVGGLGVVKDVVLSGPSAVYYGGAAQYSVTVSNDIGQPRQWSISPAAGTINSAGVVTWDANFPAPGTLYDNATITATIAGNCGSSASNTYSVTVTRIVPHVLDGGGESCSPSEEFPMKLQDSQGSVTYRLFREGNPTPLYETIGSDGPNPSQPDEIDFVASGNLQLTTPGTYYVEGSYSTYTQRMYNDVTIDSLVHGTVQGGIQLIGFYAPVGQAQTPYTCTSTTAYKLKHNYSGFTADWRWMVDGSPIPGVDNQVEIVPTLDGVYSIEYIPSTINVTANCLEPLDVQNIDTSTPSLHLETPPDLNNYNLPYSDCDQVRTNLISDNISSDYLINWYDSTDTFISQGTSRDFTGLTPGVYKYYIRAGSQTYTSCYSVVDSVMVTIHTPVVSFDYPDSSSLLGINNNYAINWSSEHVPDPNLITFTAEKPNSITVINPASWTIPPSQPLSTDYKIHAEVCGYHYDSDTFRIGDLVPRDLISPKTGAALVQGTTLLISWNEVSGNTFHVFYQKEGFDKVRIDTASNTYTSTGGVSSFNWIIPGDLQGDFKIIVEEENQLINFLEEVEIVAQLQVLAPNYATLYGLNENMNINWSGGSAIRGTSIKIKGYDENVSLVVPAYELSIDSGAFEDRELSWTVDPTLNQNFLYKISVSHELQAPGDSPQELEDSSDDFFLVQYCPNAPKAAISGYNYVKSYTARIPMGGCISSQDDASKVQESITFLDGLGREQQNVTRQFTPDKRDLVQQLKYDQFGRQVGNYLPFSTNETEGLYITNWGQLQYDFYDSLYSDGTYAYNEKVLERSPLGRTLAQAAPGAVWSVDSTHMVEYAYVSNNASDVKHLRVDGDSITDHGTYAADKLFSQAVTDENTGDKEGKTIEFSNLSGQTIMKEVKLATSVWASTHYIYDDLGNLRYVLQPEGVRLIEDPAETSYTWASLNDEAFRKHWMFSYQYDDRRRMIAKRVPGSDWVYMVYDKRDRLVLTQDGNQRKYETLADGDSVSEYKGKSYFVSGTASLSNGFEFTASSTSTFTMTTNPNNVPPLEWTYTKYDVLNRPVVTGHVLLSDTREELQNTVNSWSGPMTEVMQGEYAADFGGYSNQSFPNTADDSDLLTVNYYDNYNFLPLAERDADSLNNLSVKGLATGSLTRVLGSTTNLLSVSYYDLMLRLRKSKSQTHVTSGSEEVQLSYFSLVSPLVTKTERKHTGPEGTFHVNESSTYDHMDRLKSVVHEVGQSNDMHAPVVLNAISYDDLGQLIEKNLGDHGTGPAQSVDYQYNIRGWLNSINNYPTVGGGEGDKYWLWLRYYNIYAPSGWDQFNGNIGAVSWRNAGTSNADRQWQILDYDNASRLTKSLYGNSTNTTFTGHFNSDGIQYDHNGNIQTLNRYQSLDNTKILIDGLSYDSYTGNQLKSVTDNGDATLYTDLTDTLVSKKNDYGFRDGNVGTTDYFYDPNGNMIADLNKDITYIGYNHLNLPEQVTFGNGNSVKYTYDAAGTKLKKESTIGANVTTTDYIGGIHYKDGTLGFVQHADGRIRKGIDWHYEYNLTDHLGNVRVSVDSAGTVIQADDYYPFGLTFNSYSVAPKNQYLFQGQEHQEETGWDSFKWRNADPALGRFFNVDPLAESFYHNSTYAFSENKVISHIELEGLEAFDAQAAFKKSLVSDKVQNKVRQTNASSHNMFKGKIGVQGAGIGGSFKLGSAGSLAGSAKLAKVEGSITSSGDMNAKGSLLSLSGQATIAGVGGEAVLGLGNGNLGTQNGELTGDASLADVSVKGVGGNGSLETSGDLGIGVVIGNLAAEVSVNLDAAADFIDGTIEIIGAVIDEMVDSVMNPEKSVPQGGDDY